LQILFNGDKLQDIKSLIPDNVLNSDVLITFLRYHIHELRTVQYCRIFMD